MERINKAVNYVKNRIDSGRPCQLVITTMDVPFFENTIQEDYVDATKAKLEELGYVCDGPYVSMHNEKFITIEKRK